MKLNQHNLTQATAILLMSTVVVKLIGALFKIPLSADYALGDLGFGYFSAAYDLYIPIYTLALSGFPVAISRIIADFVAKKQFNNVDNVFKISFKTLLITGLVGSVLMGALSVPLVLLTDNSGQSVYCLLAIAPSILFCSLASVYRGYFEGLKNMTPTAVSNIIEALGKLILGLFGAVITMKLFRNPALSAAAAMLGITLGTLISVLYLILTLRGQRTKIISIAKKDNEKEIFKKLVYLAIPVAIASLSVSLSSLIDSITLRSQLANILNKDTDNIKLLLKGTTYDGMGILEIPTLLYGIKGKAHTIFNLVPTFTTAIGVGALPLITECFVNRKKLAIKKNTELLLKYSSVISFPAAFGFIFVGEEIMKLLFGNISSVLGGRILGLYGVVALFAGLCVPITSLLQAVEKQKVALINIVLGMLLKFALNLTLIRIPEINIYGSVLATIACYILIFVLHFICVLKTLKFLPNLKECFLKPLFSALVCGIVAYLISKAFNNNLGIVVSIGFAGAIYFLLLFIFKEIKLEEIKELRKKS